MVHLVSDETVVREWQVADAEHLAALANDRRVSINLRDVFPYPYDLQDARLFISMARKKEPSTFFAVESSGELCGGIGYTLHKDVERIGAEVGYWLGYEFWGQGTGTAALGVVTGHIFRVHEEICRIYAVPFSGNLGSARILEKVGYRLEGTLRQSVIKEGRVLDQWMYAILREDWAAPQAGNP